ncbi:MAG: type IV secretory system conjugative DNA transfer family protein, partial [Actinobacteria bacterium]|nr:type IV secretory system conjugative DNA transfer family protein [Actinomycetota bacterium]
WVAAGTGGHVVAMAPTGSGKTSALVIPAVLRLGGPLVVTSSKGDIVEDSFGTGTLAWRSRMGACHVFDPSGSTPYPCVPWSPLGRAATWQGALQVARSMLSAANAGQQGAESSTSKFFSERAEQSLAPLLHAAATSDGEFDLGDVHRWVRRREWTQPEALLTGESLEALENLTVGSKESLGDTLGKIGTILRAYEDPTVRRNTSEPIWSPAEMLEGADTLYVVYGPDAERLAPVYTALVDEVIDAARRKALRDGPMNPPLWLLLDEAGTGLALADLPATLARSRGEGIRFLTVWQDLGQLAKLYGQDGRSGLLGNSAAQVWWPPDDGDTARHLSDTLGHQQVKQVSKSRSKGKGDTSESESIGTMAVLDAGEARTMSGPLLLYRGKPAAELQPVPYFADRILRQRAATTLRAPVIADVQDEAETEPVSMSR